MSFSYTLEGVRKFSEASKENRILIITDKLIRGGAMYAMVYLAEAMKDIGLCPVIVSLRDGALRNELEKQGIPCIVDAAFEFNNILYKNLVSQVGKILINGIDTYYFIEQIKDKKEIFWWLHDSENMYTDNIDINQLKKMDTSAVHILAVSKNAKEVYQKNVEKREIKELMYGIPQPEGCGKSQDHSRKSALIFCQVGGIYNVKAQDIFIKAIKMLPEAEIKKCEFWIIGSDFDEKYAVQMRNETAGIAQIKWLGEKGREELDEIYRIADVVVCPSRQETLSIVATEGMMYGNVCLVSDKTGIAEFIKDGVNGLICETGSAESLKEKMRWIIKNQDKAIKIGQNARQTYEEYFTMEDFKERIRNVIGAGKV